MEDNKTQTVSTTNPTASRPTVNKPAVAGPNGAKSPTAKKKRRYKQLPVWGKILIIFGLIFGSLLFGLIIGYSIIGKGPLGDVFSFSTWKHILDLIIG